MTRPVDCSCTCGSSSRHWLPEVDGLVGCEVVGCECRVRPTSTCSTCGLGLLPPPNHPDTTTCYSCSQKDFYARVDARFAPLTAALAARGIDASPWDTGGGVMCLEVELPKVTLADGYVHTPYVLFSDEAEWSGAGVYLDDDGSGLTLDAPTPDNQPVAGWHNVINGATLGARTGAWFANLWPALLKWVADEVTTDGKRRLLHLSDRDVPVVDVTVHFDTLPTLPDTEVGRQ